APHHNCYILLHALQPPGAFPSVYHTPLSLEVQRRASKWGGLVNFSWFGEKSRSGDSEGQAATVFSHLGGRLEIPLISLENVDEVERTIQGHLSGPPTELTSREAHIYVCTHGARDCRCGIRGRQVFEALLETVRIARDRNPHGPAAHIKVGEVGHVGGHRYAANVLIFPQGEWLGLIKPEDAPEIIVGACEALEQGVKPLGLAEMPFLTSHWRGRMGLTKQEQKELF
ncbi:Sucrase/ferredoxin-like-domain-containing protein, partial [Flammula alnicola]